MIIIHKTYINAGGVARLRTTSMVLALHLCCFLLLSVASSSVTETKQNLCSEGPAYPPLTDTTANKNSSSVLINRLVTSYQAVLDYVIDYQSMSWLYGVGYRNIDEVATNSCPTPISPLTFQPTYKKRRILSTINSKSSSSRSHNTTTNATSSSSDGFIQDDENDIGGYFDELLWLCRGNSSDNEQHQQQQQQTTSTTPLSSGCWNLLYSLVHDARCTTRMDSRTTCRHGNESVNNESTTSSSEEEDVWTMLESHHNNNNNSPDEDEMTLNIIIVGAGPVGLLLVNALSQLQIIIPGMNDNNDTHSSNNNNIRVTVFENRASAPGVKLPYTRGWGYAPDLTHLKDTADERIVELFTLLGAPSEPGEDKAWKDIFSIPINVLETLLLLSNRQRGVQFIYGEDITQFMPDLQQRIPNNLLVLDVSGHRLNTLERGPSCQQKVPPQDNPPYSNTSQFKAPRLDDPEEWDWIPPQYFPSMKENGHLPDIVQQNNSLLYPVHASTGQPLASYWMHVHDLPGDCAADDALYESLYHPTDDATSNLCKACRDRNPVFDDRVDKNVAKTRSWLREQSLARGDVNGDELSNMEETANRFAQLVEYRGLLGAPASQTSSDTLCSALCVPNSYYDGTDYYREDIQELMKAAEDNKSGPWFTARLVNFNFSPEQAMAMMEIVETHGYATDPTGMPVSELPLSLMAHDPILQENNLLEVLGSIATCAGPKHPTITIFLLRPYLYREALVKPSTVEALMQTREDATTCANDVALPDDDDSNPHTLQEPFQMLRMGDSLMSGDVTLNSGLYTHVMMIRAWMCTLRGAELTTCFA